MIDINIFKEKLNSLENKIQNLETESRKSARRRSCSPIMSSLDNISEIGNSSIDSMYPSTIRKHRDSIMDNGYPSRLKDRYERYSTSPKINLDSINSDRNSVGRGGDEDSYDVPSPIYGRDRMRRTTTAAIINIPNSSSGGAGDRLNMRNSLGSQVFPQNSSTKYKNTNIFSPVSPLPLPLPSNLPSNQINIRSSGWSRNIRTSSTSSIRNISPPSTMGLGFDPIGSSINKSRRKDINFHKNERHKPPKTYERYQKHPQR